MDALHEAIDRFSSASGRAFLREDPGMGAGSGENYLLIRPPGSGPDEVRVFCLVHGIADDRQAPRPARAQLEALGVTDPGLLSLAWTAPPPGHRRTLAGDRFLLTLLLLAPGPVLILKRS